MVVLTQGTSTLSVVIGPSRMRRLEAREDWMLGKDETDRMQGSLSVCSRVVRMLNESPSSPTSTRRQGQQRGEKVQMWR